MAVHAVIRRLVHTTSWQGLNCQEETPIPVELKPVNNVLRLDQQTAQPIRAIKETSPLVRQFRPC